MSGPYLVQPPPPEDPLALLEESERSLLAKLDELRLDKERLLGHAGDSAWLSFDDVLGRLNATKDRLSTGMPGLDRRIDGGFHRGCLTIVQGRPGIGKSLFSTQIGLGMAPICAVSALYADEGVRGAGITIGQQLGAQKRLLEACDPEVTREASARMKEAARAWRFLDPQSPTGTLETLIQGSRRFSDDTGLPPLWLVDSIQTVRSAVRNPKLKLWENVTSVMNLLREEALRHGAIVIAVSKVTRGSYAHKDDGQNTEEIASGQGGGDLEYMAELLLHLKGEKNSDHVTLKAAKNRLSGEEFELPLMRDRPRKAFVEVETPPEAAPGAYDQLHKALLDSIVEFVRRNPDCPTRLVNESVPGKGSAITSGLKELRQAGRLFNEAGPKGSIHWYLPRNSEAGR